MSVSDAEPIALVWPNSTVADVLKLPSTLGMPEFGGMIPLYAQVPAPNANCSKEVTGAMIDAGAHALEFGTDLSLSWEELCTLSELVLNAALNP